MNFTISGAQHVAETNSIWLDITNYRALERTSVYYNYIWNEKGESKNMCAKCKHFGMKVYPSSVKFSKWILSKKNYLSIMTFILDIRDPNQKL